MSRVTESGRDSCMTRLGSLRRRRATVQVAIILACLMSLPSGAGMAADGPQSGPRVAGEEQGAIMARVRLAEFERDFNRRDADAVIAQYDRSFIGILAREFLDYEHYTAQVRSLLVGARRPVYRIEVRDVRVLDPTHVLANGVVHTREAEHPPGESVFTVVYARMGMEWRLVYSHSGPG
jgi:hypothetical protein